VKKLLRLPLLLWWILKSFLLLLLLWIRSAIKKVRGKMTEKKIVTEGTEKRPQPQSAKESGTKPPFPSQTSGPGSPAPAPGSRAELRILAAEEPEKTGKKSAGLSGTISPDGDALAIDNRLAGQLFNLPFELIHVFEPAWEPMDDDQLERIAEPFNIFLQERGLTKLKKPELILLVYSLGYVIKQSKNVKDAIALRKKERELKVAANDRRPAGSRENVPGVVDGPKVEGSARPDPGL